MPKIHQNVNRDCFLGGFIMMNFQFIPYYFLWALKNTMNRYCFIINKLVYVCLCMSLAVCSRFSLFTEQNVVSVLE